MIALTKNGILHRIFLFVLRWSSQTDEYTHKEQTNLCFFLRTMIFTAPLMLLLTAVVGPIVFLMLGLDEAWKWTRNKFRRGPRRPSIGPSRAKVVYMTAKGKICPAVVFE